MTILARDRRVSIAFTAGSTDVIMMIRIIKDGDTENEIELVFEEDDFSKLIDAFYLTDLNFSRTFTGDENDDGTVVVKQWFDM